MQTITVRIVHSDGRSEIRQTRKSGARSQSMRSALREFREAFPQAVRVRAFRCAETL